MAHALKETKPNEHFLAKMTDVVDQVLLAHGMLPAMWNEQVRQQACTQPAVPSMR